MSSTNACGSGGRSWRTVSRSMPPSSAPAYFWGSSRSSPYGRPWTCSSIQVRSTSSCSGLWATAPSTPKPPALVTAATTSRQWLNARIGNSTPSTSLTRVCMALLLVALHQACRDCGPTAKCCRADPTKGLAPLGRLLGRGLLLGGRLLGRRALLGSRALLGRRLLDPALLGRAAHDRVLERLQGRDARLLRGLDVDGLAGGRVATHARRPLDLGELCEPADRHLLAARDSRRDDISESAQDPLDVLRFGADVLRHCVDELSSVQPSLPLADSPASPPPEGQVLARARAAAQPYRRFQGCDGPGGAPASSNMRSSG